MVQLDTTNFNKAFENLNSTLFIMFLGTVGGFIGGNITSCAIQKIIKDKVWVSHIILLLIIYFTSSFTGNGMHPIHTGILTIALYVLFTVIMKNNYITLILGMTLFLISYQIEKYLEYLEKKEMFIFNKEILNDPVKLNNLKKYIQYTGLSIFVIGFVMYLVKQMKDKGSQFNFGKFLFGTGKCTNL